MFLLQELRNFRLEVEVPSKHHTKLIGRRGAVVNKIRTDHDVQIIFPDKDKDRQNTIVIIGLEDNVIKAREEIMQKVQELVSAMTYRRYNFKIHFSKSCCLCQYQKYYNTAPILKISSRTCNLVNLLAD